MDWWNALWLNEGFATKTEYVGVDHLDPAFGISRQFQSSVILVAMRADAFATVQQLTQEVTSSAAVEAMFSAISYDKGGAILWMLQDWLRVQEGAGLAPSGSFYSAVGAYLASHKFGNAAPTDLWAAFASASGIPPLAGWMAGYDETPGYAVVRLAWADPSSEATGVGVLTVSQSRFFASPYSAGRASPADVALLYWVPLTLTGATVGSAGGCWRPLPPRHS